MQFINGGKEINLKIFLKFFASKPCFGILLLFYINWSLKNKNASTKVTSCFLLLMKWEVTPRKEKIKKARKKQQLKLMKRKHNSLILATKNFTLILFIYIYISIYYSSVWDVIFVKYILFCFVFILEFFERFLLKINAIKWIDSWDESVAFLFTFFVRLNNLVLINWFFIFLDLD